MKKLLPLLMSVFLVATAPAASLKDLPAEKFRAAGLHKLTEAEFAELEAAIQALTEARVAVVEDQARVAVAAAETKAQQAETKAQEAEKKVEANARGSSGWFGALLTLQKAGERESEEIQGTLKGTLKSFRGRRSFTLTNGQVWQMIEDESYAGPAYTDPAVFIRPGSLGTFWLRIPQAAIRVKVKPARLE